MIPDKWTSNYNLYGIDVNQLNCMFVSSYIGYGVILRVDDLSNQEGFLKLSVSMSRYSR